MELTQDTWTFPKAGRITGSFTLVISPGVVRIVDKTDFCFCKACQLPAAGYARKET